MNDSDEVRAWIAQMVAAARSRLEHARRAFVDEPSEERLHDVRTSGRRLRSLLEDVRSLHRDPELERAVRRAAEKTDAGRDAAVLAALLERTLDPGERPMAAAFLGKLAARCDTATAKAVRALKKVAFE